MVRKGFINVYSWKTQALISPCHLSPPLFVDYAWVKLYRASSGGSRVVTIGRDDSRVLTHNSCLDVRICQKAIKEMFLEIIFGDFEIFIFKYWQSSNNKPMIINKY